MKTPKRLKQRIGMVVAILTAYAVVTGIAPRVFVANTPEIDSNALANLVSMPSDFIAMITGNEGSSQDEILTNEIPRVAHPEGTTYEPIAKGVYASEPDASGQRYIKIERGTQLEKKEVTLDDGSVAVVYIPLE